MIQKIAFGILAFALAIAAVTVVAGNVLSYGWKESLPDVGWAAAIALAAGFVSSAASFITGTDSFLW